MNRVLRAALVAAVAAATLVAATAAAAANTASVGITVAGTSTTIHVSVPQTTESIAAITFFVPAGWSANLSAAQGSTIGQVDAQANAHDSGLTLPLSGPVTVASPTAATADCAGGTHGAIWNLNLSVAGQTLVVPVYVDPTSGATAAVGAYQMLICLPPWDVPANTPGRAYQGAQLLDAKFTVTNIFTAPSGAVSIWHNLFRPYNTGQPTANAAGTFEAQSIVGTPSLSLKVKKTKTRGGYAAAGKLTQGGQAVSNATVVLLRGSTSSRLIAAGTTKTGTSGAWAKTGRVVGKKLTFFKAMASAGETAAAACVQPLPAAFAPGGCAGATVGSFSVTSPVAKFKP